MRPVNHLLMDLDGTLVGNQALPLGLDFARRALGVLRRRTGWAKAALTLLAINRELKKKSIDRANDIRVVELVAQRLGTPIDEARKLLRDGLFEFFPDLERHFFPIQGAKEFLDWAKDRYPLTLATMPIWPPEIVELRVRWAGVDPRIFSYVTHIREMHASKPEPEYFEAILKKLGAKAEDCLLVGNDEKMDLPAVRVGIRVFIVGRRHPELIQLKLEGAKAEAWAGTYAQLRELLESSRS